MINLLFGLLLSLSPAQAGTLAGVTMPDTQTVGGESLVLNGMGLREKLWIDVYVGGLYLKSKTSDPTAAISVDEPKRIEMAFIYSEVADHKLAASFDDGLAKQANATELRARFDKLNGMMDTVVTGDRISFDYVPGTGTKVVVKGKTKGTIEGVDFMRGLWTVYLGSSPPTTALKTGMMGQ